jgi:copper(I)-binding protein
MTRRPALAGLAVLALTFATTAGCARHSESHRAGPSAASAATGHAAVGALTITGGYIPQPASPDVAAAYLTIANSGAVPDTVVKIVTDVTGSVMAMTETARGGVGSMTDLAAVTVPAHGRVALTPGHAHLMLDKPTTRLRAGQHVSLTITFARAGSVTLTLPVVPLAGP